MHFNTAIGSSSIGDITGNFISNEINVSRNLYGGGLIGNYSEVFSRSEGDTEVHPLKRTIVVGN